MGVRLTPVFATHIRNRVEGKARLRFDRRGISPTVYSVAALGVFGVGGVFGVLGELHSDSLSHFHWSSRDRQPATHALFLFQVTAYQAIGW